MTPAETYRALAQSLANTAIRFRLTDAAVLYIIRNFVPIGESIAAREIVIEATFGSFQTFKRMA